MPLAAPRSLLLLFGTSPAPPCLLDCLTSSSLTSIAPSTLVTLPLATPLPTTDQRCLAAHCEEESRAVPAADDPEGPLRSPHHQPGHLCSVSGCLGIAWGFGEVRSLICSKGCQVQPHMLACGLSCVSYPVPSGASPFPSHSTLDCLCCSARLHTPRAPAPPAARASPQYPE